MEEAKPKIKFNPSILKEYSEGDVEFETELIVIYKQSLSEDVPKLKEALKKKDEKERETESVLYSHNIKGGSLSVGTEHVRWVGAQMEHLCRQKKYDDAAKYLPQLEDAIAEATIILDKYIADGCVYEGEKDTEEEDNKEKKEEEA